MASLFHELRLATSKLIRNPGTSAAIILTLALVIGFMSFHVTQRTAELAVRLAVGAQAWQIFSIVPREVLLVAGVGCSLGLIASASLRSYASSILFGVSATDPVLLGVASLTLVTVAVFAGLIPARRAASIDPAITLRKE